MRGCVDTRDRAVGFPVIHKNFKLSPYFEAPCAVLHFLPFVITKDDVQSEGACTTIPACNLSNRGETFVSSVRDPNLWNQLKFCVPLDQEIRF